MKMKSESANLDILAKERSTDFMYLSPKCKTIVSKEKIVEIF